MGSLITRWALRVCGLSSIQNLSYIDLQGTEAKDFIDNLWTRKAPGADSFSKSGNLLFAFTSSQYQKKETLPVLDYLVQHPNTKIIHFYKNNAHGPSVVFIAMYHAFPSQVKLTIKNNVKEVLSYLNKDSYGGHYMKKGAENAL